uniref:Uncharacterized protein n=1 Tax=Oryza punctata TaxID=4537 RepID=A0A0E0JK51_ORYPU
METSHHFFGNMKQKVKKRTNLVDEDVQIEEDEPSLEEPQPTPAVEATNVERDDEQDATPETSSRTTQQFIPGAATARYYDFYDHTKYYLK